MVEEGDHGPDSSYAMARTEASAGSEDGSLLVLRIGPLAFEESLRTIMTISDNIARGSGGADAQTDASSEEDNVILEVPTYRPKRLFFNFYPGRDNTRNVTCEPKVVPVRDASQFQAEGPGVCAEYKYEKPRDLARVSVIIGRLVKARWDIDLHYVAIGIVIVRSQV